ncbi:hypothetical protein BS50DRAFT_581575 [Corynespora cassiicola Philippines]|uniref:Uncharacterized protein n=1 Tax=Corynespora cassiicola Philippines TaxID=1448308 RepID=A0A2T2PAX9_CORCC|nr:hypothetical protein BS50DRAFT_581575 [Corynespora cassiicola Philippines]
MGKNGFTSTTYDEASSGIKAIWRTHRFKQAEAPPPPPIREVLFQVQYFGIRANNEEYLERREGKSFPVWRKENFDLGFCQAHFLEDGCWLGPACYWSHPPLTKGEVTWIISIASNKALDFLQQVHKRMKVRYGAKGETIMYDHAFTLSCEQMVGVFKEEVNPKAGHNVVALMKSKKWEEMKLLFTGQGLWAESQMGFSESWSKTSISKISDMRGRLSLEMLCSDFITENLCPVPNEKDRRNRLKENRNKSITTSHIRWRVLLNPLGDIKHLSSFSPFGLRC